MNVRGMMKMSWPQGREEEEVKEDKAIVALDRDGLQNLLTERHQKLPHDQSAPQVMPVTCICKMFARCNGMLLTVRNHKA
jgi:hypothetical protein